MRRLVGFLTMAGWLCGPWTAQAQTIPFECAPMTITTDGAERDVLFIDAGSADEAHGDARIGHRPVLYADGERAGVMRWIVTSLDPAVSERDHRWVRVIFLLEDGDLYIEYIAEGANPAHDTSQATVAPFNEGIVVGGTGAFAGASGALEVHVDDPLFTFELDLRCD